MSRRPAPHTKGDEKMSGYKGKPGTQSGSTVGDSCGEARPRTSYVQFSGVVGGIVGSLIGYTFFEAVGALIGGFLGIVGCELVGRRIFTTR